VEGWYAGDAERMRSALHPDLAKRISMRREDGTWQLQSMTADELVAGTARGAASAPPRPSASATW
jgi:hypothetical protein